MIKNYLYTIGRYLNATQREEVLKEIEANIYDYLEECYGKKDYQASEIEAAIRAMGHPKKVAEAYMNRPISIIAPSLMDTYWLVLKIAIFGALIGITVTNVLSLPTIDESLKWFIRFAAQIWEVALSTFGMVTLIFMGITHYQPEVEENIDEDWNLNILEEAIDAKERISVFEIIVESFFICLGLVIINQTMPIFAFNVSERIIIPVLNMDLVRPFIIAFSILLSASLVLNVYLLIVRHWTRFSRVVSILLDFVGVVIFLLFAMTPDIINVEAINQNLNLNENNWVRITILISVAVVVIISVVSSAGHMKRLLGGRKQ